MKNVEQSRPCSRCARREAAGGQRYCQTCKNEKNRERRLFFTAPYTTRDYARRIAGYAVQRGKLSRRECELCGTSVGVEKHHVDYSRPLEVVFVCREHHRMLDELRRGIEQIRTDRNLCEGCG